MTPLPSFDTPPAPGELRPVVPGLDWVRLPLPFRLNHVNCWILRDERADVVVDCGVDDEPTRALWRQLRSGPLASRPVERIVATHGHTDHVGAAGFLTELLGAPFASTKIEWMSARLRYEDARKGEEPALDLFLASHGCGPDLVRSYLSDRLRTSSFLGQPPAWHQRLRDGDLIAMGGRRWRVICAGGHAEEHASFYCEAEGILIAGDQILPRISPVVIVGPSEPDADPLGDYLASLPLFAGLPEDTLILPGHGRPFVGLRHRARELAAHHAERLDALSAIIREPVTASAATDVLFARAVKEGQGRLALVEPLAHLHRLLRDGRATRWVEKGVFVFRAA